MKRRSGAATSAGPAPKSCHGVESLLEAAGVALLGLRQRLEPVGNLVEALFARGAGHAGVHVGLLVGLAGDRRLEIQRGLADRLAGRGIADLLEVLQMAVGVAGLAFGGGPEDRGDIVVAFDVGLLCEVEVAAVRLALTREGVLQVLFGLRVLQRHGSLLGKIRSLPGASLRSAAAYPGRPDAP